jgi:hypothetical protein
MKWSETDNSLEYALEEINFLKASIQRVRELHVPKEYENTCKTCDKTDMGVTVPYPCPTIKALDGEQ